MLPRAATEFYALQQRVNATAQNEVARLWRHMGDDFDASWRLFGPSALAVIIEAQSVVAEAATRYVPSVLAETGLPDRPEGAARPGSLVGIASDGRSLSSLLYGAVTETKVAVGGGASTDQALARGGDWLNLMTALQVADTARQMVGVMTTSRKNLGGTVRVLNPPSCQRCAILAGRFYKWSTGFQRHPRCFPAGVVVSGPATLGASRRWYEGELVVLRTASGEELPTTANHPVLTNKGWVPAHLLQVGDQVVRSTVAEGALPLVVPDEKQAPTLVEDVRRSDDMVPLGVVPTSPEDFHGDGGYGEVDVVLADRLLRNRLDSPAAKFTHQEQLARRVAEAPTFAGSSPSEQLLLRMADTAHRIVSGGSLGRSLVGGHASRANLAGGGHVAEFDTLIHEALANHPAGDAVAEAERVLALSGAIRRRDVSGGQLLGSPRWDAPAGALTVENLEGYAGRGLDLLPRLAGQVAMDRIVKLERVSFRGHVYNLTSAEGWFSANGLIVSNCDCVNLPSASAGWAKAEGFLTDPMDAYRRGEIRDLTEAQKFAIDNGADISRVVNATRGMSTTATNRSLSARQVHLADKKAAFEAGAEARRRASIAAGHPDLLATFGHLPRATNAAFPTPEGLYQQARDRDDAIRLLKHWGYLD